MLSTAVITGASSGIGASIAQLLSSKGYDLILLARDKGRLAEVAQQCSTEVFTYSCDLTSESDIRSTVKEIEKLNLEKPINTLINNAGVFAPASFEELAIEEWDRQYQTSVRGPVLLTQLMEPFLSQATNSSVVNISSCVTQKPITGMSAYSSLKSAMDMWSKVLALEWASKNIRVNYLAPGIIDTPIHNIQDEQREEMNSMQPLGRVGTPEEIANAVFFLCSENNSWMTGSQITIDGGISLV